MLRSDKMSMVSLYLSKEGLRNNIVGLGNSSLVQFSNSNTNNNMADQKKLIEKYEHRIHYLKQELKSISDTYDESLSLENIFKEIDIFYTRIIDLKSNFHNYEENLKQLEENYLISKELAQLINSIKPKYTTKKSIDFIVCVIETEKKFLLKKILKQKLRRNIYLKMNDIETKEGQKHKTLMLIYVIGQDANQIVKKIIESMEGRIYDTKDKNGNYISCKTAKKEYKAGVKITHSSRRILRDTLRKASQKFPNWLFHITKEKKILETISKLSSVDGEYFIGDAWVREKDLDKLQYFKSSDNKKGRLYFEVKKTEESPPTSFKNSDFKAGFQDLANVFGVPKYQEINPALFMIFTFPFLFGAMFGDIFHGLILFAISFFMIRNFSKLNHKCGIFQIILNGRFIMLTCSLGAIWFGFLYGDFGSLPVSFYKSKFETGKTYPFGIDPIWHHAENKMIFVNSLKMKLSLIIGFLHMSLGGILSILNAIHMKDKVTLYCIALPQFIAFFAFLGYLVFLCIYKWLVTVNFPSIVNTLIGMYTDPLHIKEPMYSGQMYVQILIFSIILMCIPWMIFSKPIYLMKKRKVPKEGTFDLWINSGIHTVEFGLGLISNTSSYLRLWAVSLAHVQLTSVLHQFTIGSSNWITKIITFPIYIVGTLLLLIGLEGLSACLHALRLNWIEFFSKFYIGSGELFVPLSFKMNYEDFHE